MPRLSVKVPHARIVTSSVSCTSLKGQQGSSRDAPFLIQHIECGKGVWSAGYLDCNPLGCQAPGESVW